MNEPNYCGFLCKRFLGNCTKINEDEAIAIEMKGHVSARESDVRGLAKTHSRKKLYLMTSSPLATTPDTFILLNLPTDDRLNENQHLQLQFQFVHRDLAARNVLLFDDMRVKVSDFGLTREILYRDIYIRRSNGKCKLI